MNDAVVVKIQKKGWHYVALPCFPGYRTRVAQRTVCFISSVVFTPQASEKKNAHIKIFSYNVSQPGAGAVDDDRWVWSQVSWWQVGLFSASSAVGIHVG